MIADAIADAPTERLPIYQDVLEQWFSTTDGEDDAEATVPMTRTPTPLSTVDRPEVDGFSGTLIQQAVEDEVKPIIPPLNDQQRAELYDAQPSIEVMEAVRNGLKRLFNQEQPRPPQL